MKILNTTIISFLIIMLNNSIALSAPPGISNENTDKTIILTLKLAGTEYRILDVNIINERLPSRHVHNDSNNINFNFENNQGVIMGKGSITNPNILRGILNEHNNDLPHSQEKLTDSTFTLRFPYSEGMKILKLIDVNTGKQANSGRSLNQSTTTDVNLDFSNML